MKHTISGVGCLLLMGLSWQVGAYDEDDLKELLATKDCQKCDLTKANLISADLSGAIFCDTTMSDGTINNSGC